MITESVIIRLKLSLFENTCVHPWQAWLLECSCGLDTHADTNNKSVVGEVVLQKASEQAKWFSFNITQEATADRGVLAISFISTTSLMSG